MSFPTTAKRAFDTAQIKGCLAAHGHGHVQSLELGVSTRVPFVRSEKCDCGFVVTVS